MMLESDALQISDVQAGRRMTDFLSLTKPRVVAMIVLTTLAGYYLGSADIPFEFVRLLSTLVGTAVAAGGTLALNQYLERDLDARMQRTRDRPIPDGRLAPADALAFGALLTAAGVLYLALAVDVLPAAVTAITSVAYLFAYTPLKRRTSLCSVVGAVPGALPPLTGWAAASGGLDLGAWIIFAIMFLWQIPHSLAIAQLYQSDYARAGVRLLPVIDPDGTSTGYQIVINSLALTAVGLMPTAIGLAGSFYFCIALALGLGLLASAIRLARSGTSVDARRLLLFSLVYLPFLFGTMVANKLGTPTW